MTTWLPRGFTCFVLLLSFVPVIAAPADAEVARLVKHLGDDNFDKREVASKGLEAIGEPALEAVTKTATSSDLEVRRRTADIVAVIDDNLHPEHYLTSHRRLLHICVSADGKRVLTCGYQTLRLWDAATGASLHDFEGHTGYVVSAALSLDGKRVLSGSWDGTVRLWDAITAKELRCMSGYTNQVFSVCFGPEGKALSIGDL
jgi:WD40 repeat protein